MTYRVLGYQDFFPYSQFRPNQEKPVQQLTEAVALGQNSVLIASNGTGKTIMALIAALPICLSDQRRKILFCARTFTQNARVIEESKAITKKTNESQNPLWFGALSIRGRNEMCVHKMIQRLELPPHDSQAICTSLRKNGTCSHYNALNRKKKDPVFETELTRIITTPFDAQELMDFAKQEKICPYFLTKDLLPSEKIIVCNYQWIFDPYIRKLFLENINTTLDQCIIIMDECHNLPTMAMEINSVRLTPFNLKQAINDLEAYQADKSSIRFVKTIAEILDHLKGRVQEEMNINGEKFLQEIMNRSQIASIQSLMQWIKELETIGAAINQEKLEAGQFPRNFIHIIADFFSTFIEHVYDPAFFPCITSTQSPQGNSIAIEMKCLSPRMITDPIFTESFATISLSGTLHAETFTQILGLTTFPKIYSIIPMDPPFPQDHARVLITESLTTRNENRTDGMYHQIVTALEPIIRYSYKNIGIFCASYEVLQGVWQAGIKNVTVESGKTLFREQSGLSATDNELMVAEFKAHGHDPQSVGAVLLGVCGGRNSEGEDFPGDEMNTVVVVGIPFQRPTPSVNALIKYYDGLFTNRGRIYGYIVPAMQRANQACGRPIRRMEDHGFIVLMDFRFNSMREYLTTWIQKMIDVIPFDIDQITEEVERFFTYVKNEKN